MPTAVEGFKRQHLPWPCTLLWPTAPDAVPIQSTYRHSCHTVNHHNDDFIHVSHVPPSGTNGHNWTANKHNDHSPLRRKHGQQTPHCCQLPSPNAFWACHCDQNYSYRGWNWPPWNGHRPYYLSRPRRWPNSYQTYTSWTNTWPPRTNPTTTQHRQSLLQCEHVQTKIHLCQAPLQHSTHGCIRL